MTVYHGTDEAGYAAILRDGLIRPADRRGEGEALAWFTSDPMYAALYGPRVIAVPADHLPSDTRRTRVGPESFASPKEVQL